MIRLSNGHGIEYVAASGALAFDGKGWAWEYPLRWAGLLIPRLFTVVIKTLTRHPRTGNLNWLNPFGCVRLLRGGVVNAVGLTNPGVSWWCSEVGPRVEKAGIPLVGSILGEDLDDIRAMAVLLNRFPLVGIELNASCPNTDGDMLDNAESVIRACEAVKEASKFPVILKLSVAHDIEKVLPRVRGMAEALSINSVPWRLAFPDRRSPLEHLGGGGVSGMVIQDITWPFVERLASLSDIPVIGPSVWEYEDMEELRARGARAISFGSIFLRYPWRPTLYARRDMRENGQ